MQTIDAGEGYNFIRFTFVVKGINEFYAQKSPRFDGQKTLFPSFDPLYSFLPIPASSIPGLTPVIDF